MPDYKKYSRLARKITQTLAYYNVPTVFRESYVNPETQNDEWKEIHLPDLIERALEGETIKRSELENLKLANTINKARVEQLEHEVKTYRDECIVLIDEYVEECADNDRITDEWESEVQKLQETNTINVENYAQLKQKYEELLAQKVCQLTDKPEPTKKDFPVWTAETYYSCGLGQAKAAQAADVGTIYPGHVETASGNIFSLPSDSGRLKKRLVRIFVSLLIAAALGLAFVSYRQNQTIQAQRQILREAVQYILSQCPPQGNISPDQATQ